MIAGAQNASVLGQNAFVLTRIVIVDAQNVFVRARIGTVGASFPFVLTRERLMPTRN